MPILGGIGNISEYAYRGNVIDLPDPFDFIDLFGVDPGATYYSNYVRVTGIKSKLKISVNSGTSYSLYSNVFDNRSSQSVSFDNNSTTFANFSQERTLVNNFTTATGSIKNNQSILLSRFIPGPSPLDAATVDLTTVRFDTTDLRYSATLLDAAITDSLFFNASYTSLVSVGKSTQDWIVTTRALDDTPDPFIFNPVINSLVGITVTSNSVTISGLENNFKFPAEIITSNGRIFDSGVPAVGFTTNITNGSIINLDTVSSTSYGISKFITLKVGTYTTSWEVSTQPLDLSAVFTFYENAVERPGATSFRPIPNSSAVFPTIGEADISTLYGTDGTGSYPISRFDISGLNVGLTTNITFTNDAQYSVTRFGTLIKDFADPNLPVGNGDRIRVRLTSSPSYSTTVTTTATVGTTSQQVWSITTRPDPTPPPPPPPPAPPPPPPPPTPTITYPLTVGVVVIGGGGGGGLGRASAADIGNAGGGGGAGGINTQDISVSAGQSYTITIGLGGAASSSVSTKGSPGGTSVFTRTGGAFVSAAGGGGGGTGSGVTGAPNFPRTGGNGVDNPFGAAGSGGGGGAVANNIAPSGDGGPGGSAGSGLVVTGNGGGGGAPNVEPNQKGIGGGGGGSGATGGTASGNAAGNGGGGTSLLPFFNNNTTIRNQVSGGAGFAGGGGGGNSGDSGQAGYAQGVGNAGGGAGATRNADGGSGRDNNGSGGGGGVGRGSVTPAINRPGGRGGNGVVIIKYSCPTSTLTALSGTAQGTVLYDSGAQIKYHYFTSDTTITFA